MRSRSGIALLALAVSATPVSGQAPPTTDLWLIATTTLAVPPALERGATATLWNPAAEIDGRLGVGLAIVQPPDVLGLTAVVMAAGYETPGGLRITALTARVQARDLVRTTTSPRSLGGGIPVYDQMAALGVAFAGSGIRVATQLRFHDSRFDTIREQGLTWDVGFDARFLGRFRIAAATHFFPIDFSSQASTDFYFGSEAVVVGYPASRGFSLATRYGLTTHADGGADHAGGVGVRLGRPLAFDIMVSRESQHGAVVWRQAFALTMRIGRYAIAATRGGGVNDVGAAYRVVLDMAF